MDHLSFPTFSFLTRAISFPILFSLCPLLEQFCSALIWASSDPLCSYLCLQHWFHGWAMPCFLLLLLIHIQFSLLPTITTAKRLSFFLMLSIFHFSFNQIQEILFNTETDYIFVGIFWDVRSLMPTYTGKESKTYLQPCYSVWNTYIL